MVVAEDKNDVRLLGGGTGEAGGGEREGQGEEVAEHGVKNRENQTGGSGGKQKRRARARLRENPAYFFTLAAKNALASATRRFGSSAKALLSVSMASTPDHLLFLISAKSPA